MVINNASQSSRKHQARKHPHAESKVNKILRQDSDQQQQQQQNTLSSTTRPTAGDDDDDEDDASVATKTTDDLPNSSVLSSTAFPSQMPILTNFAPVRVFQCSACHQQGTYKWVVERHIRAKHPDQSDAHVIELPAELSVKLQKITSPLKRFRCSLCSLQSKHSWVVVRVSRLEEQSNQSRHFAFSSSTSNIFTHCKRRRFWTFNPMANRSVISPLVIPMGISRRNPLDKIRTPRQRVVPVSTWRKRMINRRSSIQ